MIDLLGHIAYALLILGTILVGRKVAIGWFLRLVGSAAWVGLGIEMGMSSIWVWSLVFAAIDSHNWRKWNALPTESKTEGS